MQRKIALLLSISLLTSCTYNPLRVNNHTTGNPVAAGFGAGLGAGGVALLTSSKALMAVGGIAGGAIGYYVTTLRYASGGVLQGGGKVYKIGDYLGIYIPTDNIFEPNTADFLPQATPILDSAVAVLKRYHTNRSILISGNTSGFYRARWEKSLSEKRAEKISAYLWAAGITQSNPNYSYNRLTFVGHGDYFPLAKNLTNRGLRANSRIQITSYPSDCDILQGVAQSEIHNVTPPPPVQAVPAQVRMVAVPKPVTRKRFIPPKPVLTADFMPIPPSLPCDTMDSEGKCLDELIRRHSRLQRVTTVKPKVTTTINKVNNKTVKTTVTTLKRI